MKTHVAPIALIAAVLGLGSASAMAHDNKREAASKGWLGKPVAEATTAGKTVDVTKIKALNVDCGDVVTFRSGAKSFTWKFEVPNHGRVDLKAIAPADFNAPDLIVYVSRAESERG
ncbi:CzcE family metal-binding protein [Roseateles sp. LYH14W]|uniref:CzcE family metal-binding protein n=1 Tax=Pelomonas parva TaxID=3299032 RepID=A0ABW7F9U1_9BURK